MSKSRKPAQSFEEHLDRVATEGHEVTGEVIDSRARVLAMLNSPCAVCSKVNPGVIRNTDHGARFAPAREVKGWKVVTSKSRGLAMACSDKCAHTLNFEEQVMRGKPLHRAVIK